MDSIPDGMKHCTKCGEIKPATKEFFPANKQLKSGLNSWCKICNRAKGKREWASATPEKRAKTRVSSLERYHAMRGASPREYPREITCVTCKRNLLPSAFSPNPVKLNGLQSRCKDCMAEIMRVRRLANPDWARLQWRADGANKRTTDGNRITAADVLTQFERQHGLCFWCEEEAGEKFHLDHAIPLSKGGPNLPENIVIACELCNRRKHAKMPDEFAKLL